MTSSLICVVDASVAITLYLAEPLAAEAKALFDQLADPNTIFHVPDLFYAECTNILWKHVENGNATAAQVAAHRAAIARLPLRSTPTEILSCEALTLAVTHHISRYDACCFALAQREAVSLITADQKLVQKLSAVSLPVIWLGQWTPPAPAGPSGP